MKNSWRTTLGGLCLAIAPHFLLFGDADWTKFTAAVLASIGGIFLAQGRDNKVTSEDAGAK